MRAAVAVKVVQPVDLRSQFVTHETYRLNGFKLILFNRYFPVATGFQWR